MIVNTHLPAALACVDYFYARMFRDWPDAATLTHSTYTLSYSGAHRLTGANHLWPHTSDALTHEALNDAGAFFAHYHAAWSVIYTDSFMPQANDLLQQAGFFRRWSSPLMVLDGPPHRLVTPRSTRVMRATTAEHIHDMRRVMSEAFVTDGDVNRRVARPEHLNDPAITHYLIYDSGQPAACATLARYGGMGGVWNVGTRYRYRRQRYATSIMLTLLDDLAAEGCTTSMLMASAEGQPLYDRLGYQHIGTTYYMGPPHILRS
jgi:hypothetical protein